MAAEPPARPTSSAPKSPTAAAEPDTRARLHGVEQDIEASELARRKAEAEIEAIRGDRVRLNAALIETTGRAQAAEGEASGMETRLATLNASEEAIKRSLASRQEVVGEVLAALQRMGRKPLPVILVRPEDMLLAIRTATMLGAVVPELRSEVDALASDLGELTRLRASIATERDTLSQELASLRADRARLAALVEARQADQSRAEGSLEAERAHAADLARDAASLRDLVGRAETEAAHPPGGPDPAQLAPAVAFASAKGSLTFPVSGAVVKAFGANDGFGGTEHGLSLMTRPEAVVSTPADGRISFAGPYRSYGQLLIINTGGGYYIVLAGLARSNVAPGQFVLAGEPVGVMGDGSTRTATAVALGAAQPVLYVEFRKDGAAIDPSPWWAKGELEKVRG